MNKENAVEETLAPQGTEEQIEIKTVVEDDGAEDEVQEEKPKKKLGGFQRKALRLEAELKAMRDEVSALKAKKIETAPAAVEVKKPKEDDFNSPAEYYEAIADYKADLKVKALKAEIEESKTKETVSQAFRSKQEAYNSKLTDFVKEKPDFHEALHEDREENGAMQFSAVVNDLVLDSDVGPALIYEFAKDRDLLDKLNQMTPTQAARELIRLESTLVKPKTETKTTTTAPKPITPIKGKTTSTGDKDPYEEGISFAEYDRRKTALELKRAQKRA